MPTAQARLAALSIDAPAGLTTSARFTFTYGPDVTGHDEGDPVGLSDGVSLWLDDDKPRDLNDFTGSTQYEATINGNEAVISFPVPAGSTDQWMRLSLGDVPKTIGKLRPKTQGGDSDPEVAILVTESVAVDVEVLGTVTPSNGVGLTDGDKGDITVDVDGTEWTINAGAVTPGMLSFDPATQGELDTHEADTTSVHGIANTALLETTTGAQAKADAKVAQTITNGVTTSAPSQDVVFDALALKADLASPALTGTPTAPTAAQGTNTTQLASTAFVRAEVAALVNSAPGALDTLGEIATQLAADESAVTALTTVVGTKAPSASPTFTGTVTLPADQALTGNPTAPTQSAGNNSTRIASTAFVTTAVAAAVIDSIADSDTTHAPSRNAVYDADQLRVLKAGDTMTGELVVPDLNASGKTGATSIPFIVAGGTAGAAPASGAHVVGEVVTDASTGCLWLCTSAGTPGTWVKLNNGTSELAYQEYTAADQTGITSTTGVDVTGMTGFTFTVGTRPVLITARVGKVKVTTTSSPPNQCIVSLFEDATVLTGAYVNAQSTAAKHSSQSLRPLVVRRTAAQASGKTYKVQIAVDSGSTWSVIATQDANYMLAVEL